MQQAKTIIGAIVLGILFGQILTLLSSNNLLYQFSDHALDVGAQLFLRLLKMLVIPVVTISIICGISQLEDNDKFGKMGLKALVLYLVTTAIAIGIAMTLAAIFKVGSGLSFGEVSALAISEAPSFKSTLIQWVPSNPIEAMVNSNMLQIIIFSVLIGLAIMRAGEPAQQVSKFFVSLNAVMISWVNLIMLVAPLGIFCLISRLSLSSDLYLLQSLGLYFFCVCLALSVHVLLVYGSLLKLCKVKLLDFFRNMWPAQLFAFSISSSSASIPVVLSVVRDKLGISQKVASFVIPLGATINMDGTAIMQGVATVFIANAYGIDLTGLDYIAIMGMATMASIGTAGVPGVGLITLSMVLEQVGVPIEGIALIVGVDRVLDMIRTAVNITGDATVAIVLDKNL